MTTSKTSSVHVQLSEAVRVSASGNRVFEVFQRKVAERCNAKVIHATEIKSQGTESLSVILGLDQTIGMEGFRIEGKSDNTIQIAGNDERGLFYGIGKFLRTSLYDPHWFSPSRWRGTSIPDCSVRGIYCAFHNNFYPNAPREELYDYLEELGLWGLNSAIFHLPRGEDAHTVVGSEARKKNRELLRATKRVGLRVGLIAEPNVGFEDAPAEILASEFPDTDPPRRGFSCTRICPSQPAGFAYLSRMLDDYLAGYEDIGLDYVVAFPYDAGGCGCERCWPWGARGYVKIAKEFSRLARARYPQCKFVLGTWCFDVKEESDGEYEGLARVLEQDKSWVDYIMADSHEDFPRWPLDRGVPGGLPMLNFAEISMWGRFPWGGSGANPLPARFQRLWEQSGHALDGGFPYSEGKYEDINKFILSQFFWNRHAKAEDAVREYIAYEFSPEVVDIVTEAIYLLERAYPRGTQTREDITRAYKLLEQADAKLPLRARQCWRWRILYLRSLIDYELFHNDNKMTERCDKAYEELIAISHLENGWSCVTPPSRAYRARQERQRRTEEPLPPGSEPERDAAKRSAQKKRPPASDHQGHLQRAVLKNGTGR